MLCGLLEGLSTGNTPKLRKLIISGMCMEADGCAQLSGIIRKKALPELQELYIAGRLRIVSDDMAREQHHAERSSVDSVGVARHFLPCSRFGFVLSVIGVKLTGREQPDGRGSNVYNQLPEWKVEVFVSCSVLES